MEERLTGIVVQSDPSSTVLQVETLCMFMYTSRVMHLITFFIFILGHTDPSFKPKLSDNSTNHNMCANGPAIKKVRYSPDEIAKKRQLALERLHKRKCKTNSRKTILF